MGQQKILRHKLWLFQSYWLRLSQTGYKSEGPYDTQKYYHNDFLYDFKLQLSRYVWRSFFSENSPVSDWNSPVNGKN